MRKLKREAQLPAIPSAKMLASSCHATIPVTVVASEINKSKLKKQIISAICALLNSDGGEVICSSSIFSIIRQLEQAMNEICGSSVVTNNLDFESDHEFKIVRVKKSNILITTNYNLCLPSHSQIVQVCPKEPIGKIKELLNRKFVEQPVECGSHCHEFFEGKECHLNEEKTKQFKQIKSEETNGTTLGDRMTGYANRFSHYVSGFANHRGGHLYYGIHDDGVVEGEFIQNETEQIEITKKVEVAIKKLFWPEQVKKGKHWEIFFEPVMDSCSNPIPSTFVIVVYIAPCVGAVFVKKPECYEVVNDEVNQMSFSTWKERILRTACDESIPNKLNSVETWQSGRIEKCCISALCTLTHCLNNGDWHGLQKNSIKIQNKHPKSVEIKLVVLLQKALACSQKQEFNIATELLKEYDELVPKSLERDVFEVLRLYALAACNRQGSHNEIKQHIRDALFMAMGKLDRLRPGLVSALVNLFAGTVTDCLNNTAVVSLEKLSCDAIQHLHKDQEMPKHPDFRADLERKGYLNRAALRLGCSFSGNLITEYVDDKRVNEADSYIRSVEKSFEDDPYVTKKCQILLDLAKSMLYFRQSQNQPGDRMKLIQMALEFSQKGKMDAENLKFSGIASCCESFERLFTEKLQPKFFR